MSLVRVIPPKVTGDALSAFDLNQQGIQFARCIDARGDRVAPVKKITISGANGLELGGTNRIKYERRTLTRVVNGQVVSDFTNADRWEPTGISAKWQTITGDVSYLHLSLDVPHGAIITGYSATLDPAAHGSLPEVPTVVRIRSVLVSTNDSTTEHSTEDTTSPVASYNAIHTVTSAACTIPVNRQTKRYWMRIDSEDGASALAGLLFIGATVSFVTEAHDDGAA